MKICIETLEGYVRECCTKTRQECFVWLEKHHGFEVIGSGDERFAIRLGVVPIVGVCHIDTVLADVAYKYNKANQTVSSTELDDRLGLACWLYLSDCHNISPTIVCCDNEEVGQSTGDYAADYIREHNIPCNWIIELDRRGTDVVSYDYSCPLWDNLLGQFFLAVGQGSFSDVSRMEALGVKGCNVAIGYYSEHTKRCHAKLDETADQLERVCAMIDSLAALKMVWKEDSAPEPPFEFYRDSYRYPNADEQCACCFDYFDSRDLDNYLGSRCCYDCIEDIKTEQSASGYTR